ncbi:MAG TPA: sigma-70 family RNA polymerase sigma factor [Gemmataceae bacterium]|nr:sigma-70 family RNA polymerase sigma factor [Gemmataceae bacterium]
MASGPLTEFLRKLRGNEALRALGERTDDELLEQFVARQEEAAFAALVQRHGPMVLGVCRHLLINAHDIEDAFQAVFLVLVSKAASIRSRTLLAGWLYRVAYRVAMRARMHAARRHEREVRGVEMMAAEPDAEAIDPQLRPLLHEELNRLPEKYRSPLVLCYLQGKTHEEAARQLAWPIGTIKGRLARAREMLRPRLARRGLALSTAALASVLTLKSASACVPPTLMSSTLKAAMLVAAGQAAAAGMVSVHAAALSQGVLRSMFLTKLTAACAVLFGIVAIGASTAVLAHPKPKEAEVRSEAKPQPAAPQAGENEEKPKEPDERTLKAARLRSFRNLQDQMLAMHSYLDVNKHFPPAAIYDKTGKPLLSWRVLLLPYLEEDALFKQFHLDEPWDSKHNKPLLAKMPKQYAPPLPDKTKEKYATFYQVFTGKSTIFEGKEGMGIPDITDGTSCTIAIVEAGEAVPWTKPADLPYDDKKPLPKLGGLFTDGFHAALADGSVRFFTPKLTERTLRSAITRNGGEVLGPDF